MYQQQTINGTSLAILRTYTLLQGVISGKQRHTTLSLSNFWARDWRVPLCISGYPFM